MSLKKRDIGLWLGPLVFFLVRLFFNPDNLSDEGNAVLAATLWIGIWWVTEAIPIAATSLLPLVLFPLSGALSLEDVGSSYGHKYIFLYIGGFILALGIEKWNLHKRIALNIVNIIGTDVKKVILGFMIATAFLSMWISNTATAVMMLPIGIAIIKKMKDLKSTAENENKIFGKALMLSIAFSASIGGIATPIGTPPNLVFAGVIMELYEVKIPFWKWIFFALPISIFLLSISWYYLTNIAFKFSKTNFKRGQNELSMQLEKLGKISYEERLVGVIFGTTALAWILRGFVQKLFPENNFLSKIDDTIIALVSGLSLFLFNSTIKTKDNVRQKIMNWDYAVKLPWGILLLFGAGFAIAKGFKASGLALWIADGMTQLEGLSLILILLIIIASVNFLTEITSNVATISMVLPILAPAALVLDVHPYVIMIGATLAASCAFMLPVATPPNAVVFGSNYLKISDMARVGIWMNIISIIIVFIAVYYLLPIIWNFEAIGYPF